MSDEKITHRKASRNSYNAVGGVAIDDINTGSFQRMADSLEIIAKDKTELLAQLAKSKADYDYMRGDRDRYYNLYKETEKSRNSYKGLYLKAKKNI